LEGNVSAQTEMSQPQIFRTASSKKLDARATVDCAASAKAKGVHGMHTKKSTRIACN
jgi:hypothetical protein